MEENSFLCSIASEAINAATLAAIEKARQTNTKLLVWREGKMVEITPDEAEAVFHGERIRSE